MRRAGFCVLLVTAAVNAGAAGYVDFRSVPLGASEAEFMAANPAFTCTPTTFSGLRPFSDRSCTLDSAKYSPGMYDFGGGKASEITALFIDGRFGQLNVAFDEGQFGFVADALQAKYGKPTNVERQPYRTRGGAATTNTELTWRIGNDTVTAAHYGPRIDQGYAVYQADWMAAAQRGRRQQTTQQGLKSL